MICRIAFLFVAASLFGSTALRTATAEDAPNWLLTPPVESPPTKQDAAARAELLRRLHERQTAEFRREFVIEVPNRATGLPADYDVLLYGTYAGDAQRLEVQVRGGKATAEFSSTRRYGVRRGELPGEQIEQLTREFLYGAMALVRRKVDDEEIAGSRGRLFATHTIFFRVELTSRDTPQTLRLMTEARQAIVRNVEPGDDGVREFAHSRYCRELIGLVFAHLPEIPSEDVSADDIVRRLEALAAHVERLGGATAQRIRADRTAGSDVVPNDELDTNGIERAVVEASILGKLAIGRRAKDAAPILDRLGQRQLANHVRLVTADDAGASVGKGLLSSDWATYQLALDVARDRLQAAEVKILLDAVPRLPDAFRKAEVLRTLEPAELTAEQITSVRGMYRDAAEQRVRVAAARLLVWKTDDDDAYRDLTRIALAPVKLDGSDVYSPVFAAEGAILAYASSTGKRRAAAAELIRTLLDRIPADAHSTFSHQSMLARHLGKLGDAADLPRLVALIGRKDLSLNDDVIHGIADLDGERAIELARKQMEWFLDDDLNDATSKTSYRWSVYAYFDLIFWRRDQTSTELLVKALDKHRRSRANSDEKQPDIEALLEYLRAERVDDRASAAVRFLRHWQFVRPEWSADVGKQLIADGADEKLCQPLLAPPSTGRNRAKSH